ncbi:MAG: serine/threonine-protein kinase [Gemmatimonadaceae bacterium]
MTSGSELLERLRAATADEYEIERELGRGGMAAVFLARDIALDRHVAIKVMRPDLIDVEGVQDRFVIEARTAAQLDHPGIVTVYAVRQRAGLLFIVMKYIEGRTLEGVLKAQGRLDPATAAAIVVRVAEALHFAHGEGVVHRDVKPSNILIDTRGRPVVTDFGIARVMTAESITVPGSVLGTPAYMSPEQCRGLPATAASDQYSLGVTMYQMITGRVPFSGSLFELFEAHREQSPSPISQFVHGVDSVLEETVLQMLAKDPGNRCGSLPEVAQRLMAAGTSPLQEEELWATLAFMAGGSQRPTPRRGFTTMDPLARTNDVATPSATGPSDSWPISASRASMDPAPDAEASQATLRRYLIGSAAALLLTLVVLVSYLSQRGSATAPPAMRTDSLSPADTLTVATEQPGATLRAQDSSTTADTTPTKATTPAASGGEPKAPTRTRAELSPTARVDSSRLLRNRPESLRVECARLLERVSLGEKLTEAEGARLRGRCAK